MKKFAAYCLGLSVIFGSLLVSGCAGVAPFHPNVAQGGRAVSIAVHPTLSPQMIVASETGGAFRTTNGGTNWTHLNSLTTFLVNDVAYAPTAANVVLAVTRSWYRAANEGGVWRSTDGGNTWTQIAGAVPPESPRCTDRVSAWSVSFEPGSANVYVSHDCGVSISHDNGVTWTFAVPGPATPINADRTQNRVWSVLAQAGGQINLAADDALWFSTDGGGTWNRATSAPFISQQWVIHAFAPSRFHPRQVFLVAGGNRLYLTNDSGATWTDLQSIPTNGRPAFVRSVPILSGPAAATDLYLGNGVDVGRQRFVPGGAGAPPVGQGGRGMITDHSDPSDVAFLNSGDFPSLLATDGGVHTTGDRGDHWTLIGGGRGGFNALQITEITGQKVSGSSPHQDLYYGTQDNYVVASSDGGVTWPASVCCEGFYIRVAPQSVDHANTNATYVSCSGCSNRLADPHLANDRDWPSAPGPNPGNPFLISAGVYIQSTQDTSVTPAVNVFQRTANTGSTWAEAFRIVLELRGIPHIAGPPATPTIYQAVRRPGTTADGNENIGLLRVTGALGSSASVANADTTGLGSLGIFPTMFAWYIVLGVNPRNPNQLIAPDIADDRMKVSTDGGATWTVDAALTDAVTGSGAYQFRIGPFPLVDTIAFDPFAPCHILVGTAENGIIRTTNSGGTWAKIAGSEQIPIVSSFYFPPTGDVMASSYGRGLWKVTASRPRACSAQFQPAPDTGVLGLAAIINPNTGTQVPLKDLGDPGICPACQYLIVSNGAITDVTLEGSRVTSVSISGGMLHQVDRNGLEVPLTIPNVYFPRPRMVERFPVLSGAGYPSQPPSPTRGKAPPSPKGAAAGPPVRGLVVEGDQVRGLIVSHKELPFTPSRVPYVRIRTDHPAAGVPHVASGEEITVDGSGFAPSGPDVSPVRILIDNSVVLDNVPLNADGTFRVRLPVQRMAGDYQVRVEQRDGKRTTREQSTIKVVPSDTKERRQPGPPKVM